MVDKSEIRAAFSARLHEALDDAGIRRHGRGVDIHKQLKGFGVHKTTQAVSKWLNGEAIAETDSMQALSSWLRVRREWLEYGVMPKVKDSKALETSLPSKAESNVMDLHRPLSRVPLLSWVQAGPWCEAANLEAHEVDSWLSCPMPISPSGFALKVRGDSMTSLGSGRTYPAGCIIFVDPEIVAQPGDRVVARVPRTNEVTFKILAEDAGRLFLRPINPQYPTIEITEETHVCGKVIGSFMPE